MSISGDLYICGGFRGKEGYKFFTDCGVHPTMGIYGHVFAEPSSGPIEQVQAVEQYFMEEETGLMWTWEMSTREWKQMPDWLEFCDIPVTL